MPLGFYLFLSTISTYAFLLLRAWDLSWPSRHPPAQTVPSTFFEATVCSSRKPQVNIHGQSGSLRLSRECHFLLISSSYGRSSHTLVHIFWPSLCFSPQLNSLLGHWDQCRCPTLATLHCAPTLPRPETPGSHCDFLFWELRASFIRCYENAAALIIFWVASLSQRSVSRRCS